MTLVIDGVFGVIEFEITVLWLCVLQILPETKKKYEGSIYWVWELWKQYGKATIWEPHQPSAWLDQIRY